MHTATTGVLSRIHHFSLFRNGSELWKMLPLWRPPGTHTATTGVLSRIHRFSLFRNGSELWKMLPLWRLPETHTATTGVLSRIHRFSLFRNGSESHETLPLWRQLVAEGCDGRFLKWWCSGDVNIIECQGVASERCTFDPV